MENESNNINNTNQHTIRNIKVALIVISFLVAVFSAFRGYLFTTVEGHVVGLTSIKSFYVYNTTMILAFYTAKINHNIIANIMIILSILTYGWTYYIVQYVQQNATDVHVIIHPFYYIYFSSSIFLPISLLFNEKKPKKSKENEEKESSLQKQEVINDYNLDKDNFIFANFVLGLKGIPYDTEALLINNIPDNTLDIIYVIDNNNQTIKIPINQIKSISSRNCMKAQSVNKKVEDNETRSRLISAAVFGGNPMLQLAGNAAFNTMLDGISNNYDKMNFNTSFEITIETTINNEETKFIFDTISKPEKFINQINEKISNNS